MGSGVVRGGGGFRGGSGVRVKSGAGIDGPTWLEGKTEGKTLEEIVGYQIPYQVQRHHAPYDQKTYLYAADCLHPTLKCSAGCSRLCLPP